MVEQRYQAMLQLLDCISARMVGGQKVQVGLPHAGKTIGITVGAGTCQIAAGPGITITAARTIGRDVRLHRRRITARADCPPGAGQAGTPT